MSWSAQAHNVMIPCFPLFAARVGIALIILVSSAAAQGPRLPLRLPAGAETLDSSTNRRDSWWMLGFAEDPNSSAVVGRTQLPAASAGKGFRKYVRDLEKIYERAYAGYGLDAVVTIRNKTYVISGSVSDPYGGPGYTFYAKGSLGSRRYFHYAYAFIEKETPGGIALLNAVKALKAPK